MKQPSATRSRILDVAEELFGERGLDRVSIRNITRIARVNLAAINYHFGSKEDLIAAVFERRVVPVNEARLAALDRVEKSAGRRIPKLEAVLEAFIRVSGSSCRRTFPPGGSRNSKPFWRHSFVQPFSLLSKPPKAERPFQSSSDGAFLNQAPKW